MRTLEEVRGMCHIDEFTDCWEWKGGKYKLIPRIHAPDWTRLDGALRPQAGRRAVWHIMNSGKTIPNGWMVYGTCETALCVNPAHSDVGLRSKHGAMAARKDWYKNQPARVLANRKTARKLSTLTPELVAEIMASSEGHTAFGRRTGISREIVRRVRNGKATAHQPAGGLFMGLMRGAGA